MAERNATAAVVGAGDFIGAAIAKKFAAEGFTIFAGRRNADKLAPLVNDIESTRDHYPCCAALDSRRPCRLGSRPCENSVIEFANRNFVSTPSI